MVQRMMCCWLNQHIASSPTGWSETCRIRYHTSISPVPPSLDDVQEMAGHTGPVLAIVSVRFVDSSFGCEFSVIPAG